jgi:hypothetical protein
MQFRSLSLPLICAVASAVLFAQPADARPRKDRGERHELRQESPGERNNDRPGRAARVAQERNGGGRVLAVDPEGSGYRVKVLKDGEVRTHHVDVD